MVHVSVKLSYRLHWSTFLICCFLVSVAALCPISMVVWGCNCYSYC